MASINSSRSRVLIVDDSVLIRTLLKEILESDPRLEVVAAAKDAFEARDLIKKHNPDVLTLDIEMPKMNGIVFLKNLMRLRPMPVVMVSTLTHEGAPSTLEALELGAVDFFAKPKSDVAGGGLEGYREAIVEKVVNAARARVRPQQDGSSQQDIKKQIQKNATLVGNKKLRPGFICALGASTGGTEALKEVITSLPAVCPPIVVVQHIPEAFSTSFAARVNNASVVNVYEAHDNQKIERGSVYIAPGHSHLRVASLAGSYICKLEKSDPVNRHRPSVGVLFDSVRECANANAIGIIMTGMGADGADALLRMKQSDILTVAQDEETSVVWGMPGAAVKLGAAEKIVPLGQIAGCILSSAYR